MVAKKHIIASVSTKLWLADTKSKHKYNVLTHNFISKPKQKLKLKKKIAGTYTKVVVVLLAGR